MVDISYNNNVQKFHRVFGQCSNDLKKILEA